MNTRLLTCIVVLAIANLAGCPGNVNNGAISIAHTIRINLSDAGEQSNNNSESPVVTPDGRYVVFASQASNLDPDDTDSQLDIFLRDVEAKTTTLVSRNTTGVKGTVTGTPQNYYSRNPSISPDGRFVAFTSTGTNFFGVSTVLFVVVNPGDTVVNVSSTAGFASSGRAYINSDAFDYTGTTATTFTGCSGVDLNQSPGVSRVNTTGFQQVYLRDRQLGTTTLISVDDTETMGCNGICDLPKVSADGRYVAFGTDATNLEGQLPSTLLNGAILSTDTTVNVDSTVGFPNSGKFVLGADEINYNGLTPTAFNNCAGISANYADNTVVKGAGNKQSQIYRRDLLLGVTELVSVNAAGTNLANNHCKSPSMSDDGNFIAFQSAARDLLPVSTSVTLGVNIGDTIVTVASTAGFASSGSIYIGAESVEYTSTTASTFEGVTGIETAHPVATLVDLTGPFVQIFRRDMQGAVVDIVSVNTTDVVGGDNTSLNASISSDGRYVAFESLASDLVADDTNAQSDIFRRDMTGGMVRVSLTSDGQQSISGESFLPSISSDGRFVSFVSDAQNLVTPDLNSAKDVFLRDIDGQVTRRISIATYGAEGAVSFEAFSSSTTAGGSYVVFSSEAPNLVDNDTNGGPDIFIRGPNE